jgi:hypothetical protein
MVVTCSRRGKPIAEGALVEIEVLEETLREAGRWQA